MFISRSRGSSHRSEHPEFFLELSSSFCICISHPLLYNNFKVSVACNSKHLFQSPTLFVIILNSVSAIALTELILVSV